MNRKQRLIRDAQRHSLWMLLSVTLTVCNIIGVGIAYQEQCCWMLAICSLAAVLFILETLFHATESARHMRLHDLENQYNNEHRL